MGSRQPFTSLTSSRFSSATSCSSRPRCPPPQGSRCSTIYSNFGWTQSRCSPGRISAADPGHTASRLQTQAIQYVPVLGPTLSPLAPGPKADATRARHERLKGDRRVALDPPLLDLRGTRHQPWHLIFTSLTRSRQSSRPAISAHHRGRYLHLHLRLVRALLPFLHAARQAAARRRPRARADRTQAAYRRVRPRHARGGPHRAGSRGVARGPARGEKRPAVHDRGESW